jgi:hypothetical protein
MPNGEDGHVLDSIRAARLDSQGALHGAADGDASVARRIAVAISGRPGSPALRETPAGPHSFAKGARGQKSIRLRRGTEALHGLIRNLEKLATRLEGIQAIELRATVR